MDYKLLDKIKKGDEIKINGITFVIKEIFFHPKTIDDRWHSDLTEVDIGDRYLLKKEWENWEFFECKRIKWMPGNFIKYKNIPINSIEIL